MTEKELYQKHIETIFGIKKINDFSNEEVERAFNTLLQVLPNNGKLYKYRSFEKEKFDNYYNALKDGYLWFPQAENLNDDFDTVLYFDPVVEANNIRDFLLQNPTLYFRAIIKGCSEPIKVGFTQMDNEAFDKVLNCCNLQTGELDKNKAVKLLSKFGKSTKDSLRYINEVNEFVNKFILDNKDALERTVESFVKINEVIRRDSYIFSMSERYDINPLWAFYANNNQGFCIEYDFNKAISFSIEDKKKLLNTYMVIYSDDVVDYSFVKILKYILTGKQDKKLLLEANLDLFTQLMTKQADWSFEKEWRVMLTALEDNRVYLNLVSKIIIDERVLDCLESQKLIALCKQKKWDMEIRKTQYINVAHKFEKNRKLRSSTMNNNQIIIYQTDDGQTKIDVKLENETVWLTQGQMADLFQTTKQNISYHISNIFKEGELVSNSVVKEFLTTAADGKNYPTLHYNLDVIISVGYRVNSIRGTQFRIWATNLIKEYLIKGFTMNDEFLKNPENGYFDELLQRIRDIRSSEKMFYRKVLDIYSLSVDYNPKAEESQLFFATVQNKMHFAASGKTAAEIIYDRADAKKDFMGLTSWKGYMPRKEDALIAKNYLTEEELDTLNRIVSMYLDFAELQAKARRPMYMKDWIGKLDGFLTLSEKDILTHAGTVSKEIAQLKASNEYDKFYERCINDMSNVEKHFLESVENMEKQIIENKKDK